MVSYISKWFSEKDINIFKVVKIILIVQSNYPVLFVLNKYTYNNIWTYLLNFRLKLLTLYIIWQHKRRLYGKILIQHITFVTSQSMSSIFERGDFGEKDSIWAFSYLEIFIRELLRIKQLDNFDIGILSWIFNSSIQLDSSNKAKFYNPTYKHL